MYHKFYPLKKWIGVCSLMQYSYKTCLLLELLIWYAQAKAFLFNIKYFLSYLAQLSVYFTPLASLCIIQYLPKPSQSLLIRRKKKTLLCNHLIMKRIFKYLPTCTIFHFVPVPNSVNFHSNKILLFWYVSN